MKRNMKRHTKKTRNPNIRMSLKKEEIPFFQNKSLVNFNVCND